MAYRSSPLQIIEGGTNLTTYTTGDILYASAANTLNKLPIATVPGTGLIYDGTNVAWGSSANHVFLVEDWIAQTTAGTLNWRSNTVNAGSLTIDVVGDVDSTHPGCVTMSTNANAAAGINLMLAPSSTTTHNIILGGGALTVIWIIKLSALSDGTNTYTFRAGLSSNQLGGAVTNGVYFEYSDVGATPNWMRTTTAASATTSTSTGIGVTTNWTTLMIQVNAAATSIEFFVNGVSGGSNTLNIPTLAISPYCNLIKTLGGTARTVIIDYFSLYQLLSSNRS